MVFASLRSLETLFLRPGFDTRPQRVQVFFVESICDDPEIIAENIKVGGANDGRVQETSTVLLTALFPSHSK